MQTRDSKPIIGAVLAASALLIVGTVTSSGAEQNGKALFERRCGGCHSLDSDKEGPRLGGVYGRKAGSIAAFQYSDALKRSKVVWSDDTLDRWLTDTEQVIPDNDMSFRVQTVDERKAIIDFLKMSSPK